MSILDPDVAAYVADRMRIANALGEPEDRRAARLRLGMSQEEVAEATGLSIKAVRLREQKNPVRRRITSDAEIRYAMLIAKARGIAL